MRHPATRLFLGLLLLSFPVFAQNFVVQQPDCVIFFQFTATGQSSPTAPNAGFDNREVGCTTWSVSATSVTFTAATATLQSAPNTAAGVPGSWSTFAGATALQNTNPVTIAASPAQGFFSLVGYNPWVRVLFTVTGGPATGVVNGAAFGWRIPSAGTAQTGSSNVTIVGPLGQAVMASSIPVVIASNQSAIPVTTSPFCTLKNEITLSGTGYNTLIPASGSTVISICNIVATSASGGTPNVNTFSLAFGTCGSSPTEAVNVAGVTGYTDQFGGTLKSAGGNAACFSEATANGDKVSVTFSQQ